MFACPRLVEKATTNDEQPAPGIVLAEALQLCRKDPANVSKFLQASMKKLDNHLVQVRIKALKFLLHITQNGPPNVQTELKLYSGNLSNCMGWRGEPHPTRGYEAYQEMKDLAQQLLDLVFSEQNRPTTFSLSNAPGKTGGVIKSVGIMEMESFGSGENYRVSVSLEPKNLDPNKFDPINKLKEKLNLGNDRPKESKYGSVTNQYSGGNSSSYQIELGTYDNSNYSSSYQNQEPIPTQTPASFEPPQKRGQFDRLSQQANWANRKPELAPKAKQASQIQETPASKLLKTAGKSSAIPTASELTGFLGTCTGESIEELEVGLSNPEWKVKLRAVYGLDICGQKFGWGAVAHLQSKVTPLASAPQNSLKKASAKLLSMVEGVEPTGVPQAPSAFDFVSTTSNDVPISQDAEFDFEQAENLVIPDNYPPETNVEIPNDSITESTVEDSGKDE